MTSKQICLIGQSAIHFSKNIERLLALIVSCNRGVISFLAHFVLLLYIYFHSLAFLRHVQSEHKLTPILIKCIDAIANRTISLHHPELQNCWPNPLTGCILISFRGLPYFLQNIFSCLSESITKVLDGILGITKNIFFFPV